MVVQGRMQEANRNSKAPKFIRRIEMVQKRSIMYYQQQDSHPFLKIVVALPTMVASCRGIVFSLSVCSYLLIYTVGILFCLNWLLTGSGCSCCIIMK